MAALTKTSYANLIMDEHDCAFIPPVGCAVRMRYAHALPGTPIEGAEADVEITGINISPDTTVTLTARNTKDQTRIIWLIPSEITKILSVPDGVKNPYYWWQCPRKQKTE